MGPLCLNQFKTRSHFGSFTLTFGLSNESEQIPYVLKQGSPDMSCVAMTTCNRKIRITVTVLLNPANTSTFGAPGSAPGRHLHRLKRVPNPLSLILYYITLASTERNVCGWNQEVVTGVNSLQRHADSTKKHWYSSTVFQVAEVSHLQDGVVLPGVFGVVPLQETPPRGAARPSKLRQVQVSKAQLQENTREFAPFSGNLTWISWIQTAAERMLACTPPPALNSLNYCLT